jgi:hypothetical protein
MIHGFGLQASGFTYNGPVRRTENEGASPKTGLEPCSATCEPGSTAEHELPAGRGLEGSAPRVDGREPQLGAGDEVPKRDPEFDHALRLQMMVITGE